MSESLPVARVESARRVHAMWLVPIAALAIVAGLVLQQWWSRGVLVEIALPRATGIEPGRTPVMSQGVPIGVVERLRLDDELKHPIVEVRLESWAGAFAREGSLYWVVRPSIGFRGVSGLETLASGPVLEARAGKDNASRAIRFTALSQAPADAAAMPGLRVTLMAQRLGSIRPGSPVTYRDIEIGEVLTTHLSTDAKGVVVEVVVAERFAPLVREGSRFWNTSGFGVDLGMTGLKLRTESIESLLGGGIALATPAGDAPAAKDGAAFELASEPEKDWLRWAPAIDLGKE